MALLLEHKEVCCTTTSDDQTFPLSADTHRHPVSPALYLRRGTLRGENLLQKCPQLNDSPKCRLAYDGV